MMVDDGQGQRRNRTGRAGLLRMTLTDEERSAALRQEILTTSVEIHA
jgi:hypothetical protein